uniref:Uncharacterized protein n=1 Tax=Zonotrichia albicollis TaxID=44394 RepID=A0A8D2MAD5_ZONAL
MNGGNHPCAYLLKQSLSWSWECGCDPAAPAQLCGISVPQVCDKVAMSVYNELQTYIRTLPVTARIDNKIGIDYSLVAPPRATTKSLDADLKVRGSPGNP